MSVSARVPERAPKAFDNEKDASEYAKREAQDVANTHDPAKEKKRGDSIVQWAVTDNLTGAVLSRGLAYPPGHPNDPSGEARDTTCAPTVTTK